MYLYSAITNSFYPEELLQDYIESNSAPSDLRQINEDIFMIYSGAAPIGKERGADKDGLPCWVDQPPLSDDEHKKNAEAQRNQYRQEAEEVIVPLARADKYGMATAHELSMLVLWEKYTVQLNRIDLSNAPNICWPQKPL
ncbi:tail fiber assembly protein [Serratia marcescens]|uniref:tail fiber assembly protein n=1 Tax=Serratia marcescens TaxID=615 RepID=UPI003ED9B285